VLSPFACIVVAGLGSGTSQEEQKPQNHLTRLRRGALHIDYMDYL
jgi:hypothetical protein